MARDPKVGLNRTRLRWRRGMAAVMVVLLLAELAARALAPRLPDPLEWHSAEAQKKVAQMDELARNGGSDVVFVGSSVVRNGADPDVVTSELGVSSYNAGLTAGVPRMMEPWTLDVVMPRLHPRVVVIGVESFDFADLETRAFFEAFIAAPAARRAMHLDDPIEHIDRWLGDHFALWANRQSLRKPAMILDAVRGRARLPDPDVDLIESDGRDAALEHQRFDERTPGAGGLPVDNWRPGTDDVDALARLVDGVLASGAEVLLVDMPVTDEYVLKHPHGEADYQTYLDILRRFASSKQVSFVEMNTMRDHRLFIDEVHLNLDGARSFTSRLVPEIRRLLGDS